MWRWEQLAKWLNNPSLGAEIGVKEGRCIAYLLNRFPKLTMYSIDPWEDQPQGNETYQEWKWDYIYNEYATRIVPFVDRVKELKTYSHLAVNHVLDKSLDFVFIDAQHDYESVKRDIKLWLPKIKEGGFISGHDYQPRFPGVIQAVQESFPSFILGDNDTWMVKI